ncbi:MAG: TldD/PmbA family protein [Chloroflexota bacterium]|nr:TldD/PmbA family protein [Chloroflexota bacterium]
MESLLPEEVLHSAKKVTDEAEVFQISSRETPIHFEANRLKQIQTKESTSIALRIFREGKIGFAQASGGDGAASLIDMAVETAQLGSVAKFQFPSLMSYPEVSIFDPQVEKVTMEEMVKMGEELIDELTQHTSDILCDVGVTKGTASVHILNSQGGAASYNKSFFSFSLEGVLIRNEDMLFVADSEGSCCLPVSVDRLAGDIIRQLEWAREKAAVPTRLLPVVFTPSGVASAFLSPLALAFNGKTILEGASPLKGKLGKQLFDSNFSMWDDATINYSLGSCPCDDEGVGSRRLPLISGGGISNFLYDLQTAALAGTQSTGHGRRVAGGFPKPGVSSLIIGEGDVSFESMIADIKEGLIVEQLIGAEQGNLLSGDFGGNVLLGYKVENGKIVGRVKDTMISGNVYRVLKELLGIGDKRRWVEGILYTPHLYCLGVSVAAKCR